MHRLISLGVATLLLSACSTTRETTTARTATEELLISAAADRAAATLASAMPENAHVYLDTTNFDALDGKYAIGAVQDALLRHGCAIADARADADTIVALRSGALAIDNRETLVGIPPLNLPIPLTGSITTPKVAFWDVETQQGIAKFAITANDAKTGKLVASSGPNFGTSLLKNYTLLLLFSWRHQDIMPKAVSAE